MVHITSFLAASLIALTASTLEVTAINYRGYSSTVSCSGDNFFCSDGGAVCCGPFPAGFGFSAQFESLPSGSQGQGYTDSCSSFLFALFGPGTKCWNGGGARATHLNWFHSAGRVAAGRRAVAATNATECSKPDGFSYTDPSSVQRTIKVPADDAAAEAIVSHIIAKDYDALSKYEDY